MIRNFIFFIFLLLITHVITLGDTMSKEELAAQYTYLDAIGKNGNIQKIETAEMVFKKLLNEAASENQKIRYQLRLASLTCAKADQLFWPHEKLGQVNSGMRLFDRIERKLDNVSDNKSLKYEFYLYQGRTYIHFPFFLNKRGIAMVDLQKAVELSEELVDRPKEELGPLFAEYAKNLDKDGNSEKAQFYAKKALDNILSDDERKDMNKILVSKSYIKDK